jgi:predicted RecB family nuclease
MKVSWSSACQDCGLRAQCTTGKERRIRRWEHEDVLDRVQERPDNDPSKLALRSMTVEHPFGTIKSWMGATHFQMRRLRNVATEMALHVLAYNIKRVMKIIGTQNLIRALAS